MHVGVRSFPQLFWCAPFLVSFAKWQKGNLLQSHAGMLNVLIEPPPLAPKIFFKSSFQAILREKPLFLANFGLRAPHLGSKLCWAPLTKILDPEWGQIDVERKTEQQICVNRPSVLRESFRESLCEKPNWNYDEIGFFWRGVNTSIHITVLKLMWKKNEIFSRSACKSVLPCLCGTFTQHTTWFWKTGMKSSKCRKGHEQSCWRQSAKLKIFFSFMYSS